MKKIIPFEVNYSPIKKLAIIPFEQKTDRIYKGFELQYIDGGAYGKGYRIIAYRNDEYVDVYDDYALSFQADEKFDVVENGLNKHVQVAIENVHFEKWDNCEWISFRFIDIENRKVNFHLKETSKKKTIPMNLLAPVGVGSKKPNFLPIFFMYEFDFLRRKHTEISCKIDDTNIEIDRFPIPMSHQFRYFVRYSEFCDLFEFANTDRNTLMEVETEDDSYYGENVEYVFDKNNGISKIIVQLDNDEIDINFIPSINVNITSNGTFKICPKERMGFIEGAFEVNRTADNVSLRLKPKGWKSVPNSFITRIILSANMVFCKWTKGYEYQGDINLETNVVNAKWINHNLK